MIDDRLELMIQSSIMTNCCFKRDYAKCYWHVVNLGEPVIT